MYIVEKGKKSMHTHENVHIIKAIESTYQGLSHRLVHIIGNYT